MFSSAALVHASSWIAMEAEPEVAARLQVADADQTRALCEELVACFTMILDPLCPQAERAVYDQV